MARMMLRERVVQWPCVKIRALSQIAYLGLTVCHEKYHTVFT